MDSLVLLLFIIGVIAIGKSSQKKKSAASAQKKQAPAATTVTKTAAPRPAPAVQPTVKPSVKPVELKKPEPAKAEPHAHSRHVVAPSFYSGHAHEEGSLLSDEARCAAVEVRRAPQETAKKEPALQEPKLAFDAQSVVQGFLYGEILGKPKALR